MKSIACERNGPPFHLPSDSLELDLLAVLPDLAPAADLEQMPVDLDSLGRKCRPDALGDGRKVVDGQSKDGRSSTGEADTKQTRVRAGRVRGENCREAGDLRSRRS